MRAVTVLGKRVMIFGANQRQVQTQAVVILLSNRTQMYQFLGARRRDLGKDLMLCSLTLIARSRSLGLETHG